LMSDISTDSILRYGFNLDRSCFVDIGTNAQLILAIVNTFVFHPFPLHILLRRSPTMSTSIRRGYILSQLAFITYEFIFFFLAQIYVIIPYPGLYSEGLLCRMNLPKGVILGFISFSIVVVQPPFAFLIVRMHQTFMDNDSPFKLSRRVQIGMASVQITLMSLNVVGFTVFGTDPENIDNLLKEPELTMLAARGHLLLLGSPGDPQLFRFELFLFYVTLVLNFSVLLFCILHTMHTLRKRSLTAKSVHTQQMTQRMFEVFFWQV
ncbi:hypothetical protein PENTCL1PPCAC_16232, partial [Pristionchus entomophagus]